jgi:hypothetical protein
MTMLPFDDITTQGLLAPRSAKYDGYKTSDFCVIVALPSSAHQITYPNGKYFPFEYLNIRSTQDDYGFSTWRELRGSPDLCDQRLASRS